MRWVSSKESVAKGELSVLAIVETLCAIALVFYLSSHFNTLRWLAIAMCVSPLLLLRTDESTRLGIDWYNRIWRAAKGWDSWMDDRAPKGGIWFVAAILVNFASTNLRVFAPLPVRIGATLRRLFRDLKGTIQSIPRNWSRVTLATDTFFAPEFIPGDTETSLTNFLSATFAQQPRSRVSLVNFLWLLVVAGTFFSVLFLPALLYRWSLKATSIIYAPLVFVAHSTFSEGKDLRTKLELIKRGDLSRIRVWYGVIAIAAFLVKLVLMMNLPGFADWWNGHPVSRILAIYVAPAEIPKWQLAELANSVLAIGLMLFARHALLRYELQHPWPEVPVERILGFVSGLRWVLALYAIVCTGYITMREARRWHLPALGEKWIPWQ